MISQVLQKLGKADETKDEQFEQVVINFRRQEVRVAYRCLLTPNPTLSHNHVCFSVNKPQSVH